VKKGYSLMKGIRDDHDMAELFKLCWGKRPDSLFAQVINSEVDILVDLLSFGVYHPQVFIVFWCQG
jgi:hypothetical protein